MSCMWVSWFTQLFVVETWDRWVLRRRPNSNQYIRHFDKPRITKDKTGLRYSAKETLAIFPMYVKWGRERGVKYNIYIYIYIYIRFVFIFHCHARAQITSTHFESLRGQGGAERRVTMHPILYPAFGWMFHQSTPVLTISRVSLLSVLYRPYLLPHLLGTEYSFCKRAADFLADHQPQK